MELTDKRKARTEKVIREVFFQMLSQMPMYKITVSELCRRADINRGTFYLHYQDCYDLIDTISNEIADKFTPYVEAICADRKCLKSSIMSILLILSEDKDIICLLRTSDLCCQIITRRFRDKIQLNWKKLSGVSDAKADLLYDYICGGVFAAIQNCGAVSERKAAEEFCESIYRVITGGLSAFVR